MRIGRLWLIPALWAALMFACNNDGPKPVSESSAAVTATPAMSARGEIEQKTVIPAATPDIQSARAQLSSFGDSVQGLLNPHPGQSSLEETVLESEVIAKVDYLRRISSVQRDDWWWAALLEFRFEVHEYLKGSGPDEIGAFVFYHYETEAAARRAAPLLAAAHDARWDDREAVVFLNYIAEHIAPEGIQLGAGQFWLADVYNGDGYVDWYSVASDATKLWLPEDTPTGAREASDSGKSSTPQRFMLDVPSGPGGGGGSGGARSAGGPTISLNDLKARITALEAEANAGGTPGYRECVELYYRERRWTQRSIDALGYLAWRHSFSMDSGLPAGTVMMGYHSLDARSPDQYGTHWYEGPDKDLMAFKAVDFVTSTHPLAAGDYEFTLQLVTARPLPAGTYRAYPNGLGIIAELCNKDWSHGNNRTLVTLNVTAPARVLHEAFFDPVDIASAVGADSSNGVLEPNAFMLNGTTTTISSLKWEDDAVSMTLNPTASLADYAIDFIDANGTTTLSLTSGNASTTALAWTVPDKPWSDGDLLMLRIHKPISTDATLSALALSGVDITFSTATTTYTASVPSARSHHAVQHVNSGQIDYGEERVGGLDRGRCAGFCGGLGGLGQSGGRPRGLQ